MNKFLRISAQFLITALLIVSGIVGMRQLMAEKPAVVRETAPPPMPAVRISFAQKASDPVTVTGEGNVGPVHEMPLIPQVGGKVVMVAESLVDGGRFRKGDPLVRIEAVDYQLALTLAESRVKDAESGLQLIEAEADAAREEWRIHYANGNDSEENAPSPLVMKIPQLSAARARLAANRADVEKARLNLERTIVKAPYSGQVIQSNVEIGQTVSPGQVLARVHATDVAEIVVPLAGDDLYWFDVPGVTTRADHPGADAVVRARIAGRESVWPGKVVRTQGRLDERTRMVHVVIRVDRPYDALPPLAMGAFATVEIAGRRLDEALIIPRSALQPQSSVWVVETGRLRRRDIEVARVQGNVAWVLSGITEDDRIVVSDLKSAAENMAVTPTVQAPEGFTDPAEAVALD